MSVINSKDDLPKAGDIVENIEVDEGSNTALIEFVKGDSIKVNIESDEEVEERMDSLFPEVDYNPDLSVE